MDPAPVSAAAVAPSPPREAPEAAPPAWRAPGGSYIKLQVSDPHIHASSKRQHSISLSSTEAEIMAASLAAQEAIFHRSLFAEMGFDMSEPHGVVGR